MQKIDFTLNESCYSFAISCIQGSLLFYPDVLFTS